MIYSVASGKAHPYSFRPRLVHAPQRRSKLSHRSEGKTNGRWWDGEGAESSVGAHKYKYDFWSHMHNCTSPGMWEKSSVSWNGQLWLQWNAGTNDMIQWNGSLLKNTWCCLYKVEVLLANDAKLWLRTSALRCALSPSSVATLFCTQDQICATNDATFKQLNDGIHPSSHNQ